MPKHVNLSQLNKNIHQIFIVYLKMAMKTNKNIGYYLKKKVKKKQLLKQMNMLNLIIKIILKKEYN